MSTAYGSPDRPADVVVSLDIAVSPERVYAAVSDVARMGQWSPEATGAKVRKATLKRGDRFVGQNKSGLLRWETVCTVTEAEAGVAFAFDVDAVGMSISHWRYEFHRTERGTHVVESWWDRRGGIRGTLIRIGGAIALRSFNRSEHNRSSMEITLARLKQELEN